MPNSPPFLQQDKTLPSIPGQLNRKPVARSFPNHDEMPAEERKLRRRDVDFAAYDPEVIKLQNELENEREKKQEMQERLNDAVHALGSLYATDQFRSDEVEIVRALKVLRYDIKAWSQNFSVPSKKSMKKWKSDPFRSISPRSEMYSESKETLPRLVQGFIWKWLLDKVFDCRVWTGFRACPHKGDRPCPVYEAFGVLQTETRVLCK